MKIKFYKGPLHNTVIEVEGKPPKRHRVNERHQYILKKSLEGTYGYVLSDTSILRYGARRNNHNARN